jgi:FixJ family two-component response regulator
MIAVIDDDVSVRGATRNLIRTLGYTVHAFASAGEFLRSIHLREVSCIITDIQMPAMTGVELQALLQTEGHRVPFIFITAFPQEAVRARALSRGAVCVLTKPFDSRALIKCLDHALGRSAEGTSQ